MKLRNAIKNDLFAADHHRKQIDKLGDPLTEIGKHIDFSALAAEVDRVAPRPVSPQGGRPPYPTETMVRILVLKRLYNLSDEQMEYQLLDCMSYQRFCGLGQATNIPDRTTIWTFENRIGEAGAKALFDGVTTQLLKKGFIARGGQIIDATLVPAPKQHNSKAEKELIDQDATPVDWKPAKRRRCDLDQEARQILFRLQAVSERGQEIQADPQDGNRHGQHPRQPAFRRSSRFSQYQQGRLRRPGLPVRSA